MAFEAIIMLVIWLLPIPVFCTLAYIGSKSGTEYYDDRGFLVKDPKVNKPFVKQGWAQFAPVWFIIWAIMFVLTGSDR